ncbi:hypothetical protein ACOSQ4_017055 [Xanthoceras sorbifolium]
MSNILVKVKQFSELVCSARRFVQGQFGCSIRREEHPDWVGGGVNLTEEVGLLPNILEANAANVVELVRLKDAVLSELGLVIDDIKLHLSHLPIKDVCFVPRSGCS